MSEGNLVPLSDEQAKAVQEALKTLQGFGGFLRETFGTVPQDVVGLLGGDWLKVRRAKNLAEIIEKTKEKLEARHVKPDEPASPSLIIPILVAAADESRAELQDLWASLLAAAADPARSKSFRIGFIEIAKKLDPLDAVVLAKANGLNAAIDLGTRGAIATAVPASRDEVDVSIENMKKLGLFVDGDIRSTVFVTPLGRELLRAVKN
jgi:hypothetical protein